jgi:putative heme iron utilization protein
MTSLTPEAAAAICRHMNDDHGDAVTAYARTFGRIADAQAAELVGIDGGGMDLSVETPTGRVASRIGFDHELIDAADARDTLIAMARAAQPEP